MKARWQYKQRKWEKMPKIWTEPEPYKAWVRNRALRVLERKYYCKEGVGRDKMLNRAWKMMIYGRSETT